MRNISVAYYCRIHEPETMAASESDSELLGSGAQLVEIPSSGVFKYVLIELCDESASGKCEILVRGNIRASYHADIYEPFESEVSRLHNISVRVLGGGRIRADEETKEILVYGYSVAYGRANHEKTVDLIKSNPKFAEFKVGWTNEGY